jgi:hypothetical protein
MAAGRRDRRRVERGVATMIRRGVPDGDDLAEILDDLARVRARLRGEGLDSVAVVREGRREPRTSTRPSWMLAEKPRT